MTITKIYYIVFMVDLNGSYCPDQFMGLFSTEEKAQQYIDEFIKKEDWKPRDEFEIKQVQLDNGIFW